MKYSISLDIDFKRNIYGGLYIAIEGIDGSGKTTQVERLFDHFKNQGKHVIKTREPRKDEGIIGKLIQEILLGKVQVPPVAFQYLFTADREMHHEELITPSLKSGKTIVSDRCFFSAVPYGILDRGDQIDEDTAEYVLVAQSILSMYHQFTLPDFVFYLDIPLGIAMERLEQERKEKGDSHVEIYEDRAKLEKTLKGYQWLLEKFPEEFVVIDGTKPAEEITREIITRIKK